MKLWSNMLSMKNGARVTSEMSQIRKGLLCWTCFPFWNEVNSQRKVDPIQKGLSMQEYKHEVTKAVSFVKKKKKKKKKKNGEKSTIVSSAFQK